MTLGNYIRVKRLALDLSLRKFALLMGMDPSHWSKIERDILPFPEEANKAELLAAKLDIRINSEEWYNLLDLISISRKIIPDHVYKDEEILRALPIFFRTANGGRPTEDELNSIINILKER